MWSLILEAAEGMKSAIDEEVGYALVNTLFSVLTKEMEPVNETQLGTMDWGGLAAEWDEMGIRGLLFEIADNYPDTNNLCNKLVEILFFETDT